ncbi:MAG: glycogen synthase [Propionibacteriaceae bacterium]|jgi:starch synthase|nr:glycogen synthase [Propionibacteriaceae bacterium]
MRVSILTREYPPAIYGGAGVHVAQLVPRLCALADVNVQCMGEPRAGATAHPELFPPDANPSLKVFGANLAMVAALPELDVVHSHTWYANLAGHLAGIYQSIPHVITAHSLEPLRPWKREQLAGGYALSSWAERTAYEGAAAIIAVSSAMAADVTRVYPNINTSKLHVIYNGVDVNEFYPDYGSEFPELIGMDITRPSVVFVGRITHQKGLLHLVRAARQFSPGVQVVLLAGSPDTPQIAAEFATAFDALRAERGSDAIWVSDMAPRAGARQILSHATVFACPSIYEPLGIVNLEAMACETAVVASKIGGIPEVVLDGITGTLVDYDPAQATEPTYIAGFEERFATAVNALIADPAKARTFGIAGRQRCIDEFSWETIAAQTVRVYQSVTERSAN